MNLNLRIAIVARLRNSPRFQDLITALDFRDDGSGTITYNPRSIWVDPDALSFTGQTTAISDEELVRAHLLFKLVERYEYPPSPTLLEVERAYATVGRPGAGKGGRIDVLVRSPATAEGARGEAFLFIECKAPDKFDADFPLIDGQLFRLSNQEQPRPRYLVYYTTELRGAELRDRLILIDTTAFPDHESWSVAGQPIVDTLPVRYGRPTRRRYGHVAVETEQLRPLDKGASPENFARIRSEVHNVIWGGGGTNNNEVFVYISKLILCKIFDEKETLPNTELEFQRRGDEVQPETPAHLVQRMNALYRRAEGAYLALPEATAGPAFDTARIAPEKIAYVVGRLEGISVTENTHTGDLLGEFFEQIVSQDFTQSKGQFFTPIKIVRFMLQLSKAAAHARHVMNNERDHLGRPRLPYVIDPSAGSGTFLIEYMKEITESLGPQAVAQELPRRVADMHRTWFGEGGKRNDWAREFIFGIENNYDLGLSAKVNMVLHGDGSMNTWIANGLLPFQEYWIEGRTNLLATTRPGHDDSYRAPLNEQFDVVLSNPPFSLVMPPDETRRVRSAFGALAGNISERLFIERWYQLLREGGHFCAVLPEAILDTNGNLPARNFLYQHFQIEAVISLSYDAFRPFTSTKTCIVQARKRTQAEVAMWQRAYSARRADRRRSSTPAEVFAAVIDELGWADAPIFMAEPTQIGYKRRKGLQDLNLENHLYTEDEHGAVSPIQDADTVLSRWTSETIATPSATLGFYSSLRQIAKRPSLRLDPKYRWLWDYQDGVGHGPANGSLQLREIIEIVELQKVGKGELTEEVPLIDLDAVERRQGMLREEPELVEEIGSDRVVFDGCELAISKLEPYLGKVLIDPQPNAIGSPEWIGLRRLRQDLSVRLIAYLLMLPDMCEAYRRLQSGKRHARFDPNEFLDLRVQLPAPEQLPELEAQLDTRRRAIINLREQERSEREAIDRFFA